MEGWWLCYWSEDCSLSTIRNIHNWPIIDHSKEALFFRDHILFLFVTFNSISISSFPLSPDFIFALLADEIPLILDNSCSIAFFRLIQPYSVKVRFLNCLLKSIQLNGEGNFDDFLIANALYFLLKAFILNSGNLIFIATFWDKNFLILLPPLLSLSISISITSLFESHPKQSLFNHTN